MPTTTNPPPTLRILSLDAGVQSTFLLKVATTGTWARMWNMSIDAAIFADTGWEPPEVYEHLDRIEQMWARPAGIPIYRVSSGHIRNDILEGRSHGSIPLFVRNPDGSDGHLRRGCTDRYKLQGIRRKVRQLLGYPGTRRIPAGVRAEMLIGFSEDEITRVRPSMVRYMTSRFPLIEHGYDRDDCEWDLRTFYPHPVPRSACVGCPFHTNAHWRVMKTHHPDQWADAVAFDAAIRNGAPGPARAGQPLRGTAYLHRSRLPLDQAPIEHVTRREARAARLRAQWTASVAPGRTPLSYATADPATTHTDHTSDAPAEHTCSPWGCRSDSEPADEART
ncbi:hypothetical protein AB0I28_32845 [Phytomonospora sp. NPDC050363]|uniref:hypothetical protein n=1 Tax=Phytomonospora sp. NPDC050363 TaxID=3155642 RepID=UPI0033CADF6D